MEALVLHVVLIKGLRKNSVVVIALPICSLCKFLHRNAICGTCLQQIMQIVSPYNTNLYRHHHSHDCLFLDEIWLSLEH